MAVELKDTLNLPVTDFPMRAGLTEREPKRIAHWEKTGLYRRIQDNRAGKPGFVLHDGPPFTNGDVHIGTALNKLLKDIILRQKSLAGFRTPCVPGWDCHGLPIEHKVMKDLQAQKKDLTPIDIRKACAAFSAGYIEKQRGQFKRLGVLADWAAEYKTMNPAYEADIIRTFAAMVEKGLVYRSKKPVYWSIPCATALAEAEIEYKDKKSPSIWVAFPVPAAEAAKAGLSSDNLAVVIWTTTPWTLPANLAVAVHPELEYVVLRHAGKGYLVAKVLADAFVAKVLAQGETVVEQTVSGAKLAGVRARHPFIDRDSPIITAEYVTTDAGTGCVHTAPGHGVEDYQSGLRHGLEVYSPITDAGTYADDGRVPAHLVGVSVLEENGRIPANTAVLKTIEANGTLLKLEIITHSYPHCWRSKTPVIFRAMDQWFVGLDRSGVRESALAAIGGVDWTPESGENRIRGAVQNRPDWCISRQRSWGVPIIAFYDEKGEAYLDAGVIRAVAAKVAAAGTDLWFEKSAAEILAGVTPPAGWPAADALKKGADTLDVWIDSGASHLAVLPANPELHWPADLYLEGSDQHRGWFQSSLWTGMIAKGAAPYKRVITHGFVVGGDGKKISKSDGKPSKADDYVNKYGADVVRLWIASENYQHDIKLSDAILETVSNQYRAIRNTLRYQLSNLYDFDAAAHAVPVEAMTLLDRWALHKTALLVDEVTSAMDAYSFHKAYAALCEFTTNTLSATYHNVLKDRLYTLAPDAPERRSAQTAIRLIFEVYAKLLSPMLPFTTDEAWSHFTCRAEYAAASIHTEDWPVVPAGWRDEALAAEFDAIQAVLGTVNVGLESLRQAKEIGQSLDAKVVVSADPADATFALLKKHEKALEELFIVSAVTLVSSPGAALKVETAKAGGVRCPRSWRWVPELVSAGEFGSVSARCREALAAKYPEAFNR